MTVFVLDASAAIAWILEDERHQTAMEALAGLRGQGVPALGHALHQGGERAAHHAMLGGSEPEQRIIEVHVPETITVAELAQQGRLIAASTFQNTTVFTLVALLYLCMSLPLIFLVSRLMKMLRVEGPIALEPHVEDPKSSALFQEYPRLAADHTLVNLIADTLRLVVVSSGTLDVHAVEEVMDNAIKTHHHEVEGPQHTLQNLADALPALGIVAAVLGVVKTMGSIDKPPAILGGMIGSALVGTFLGILLAYGFAEPLAGLLEQKIDEDGKELQCVKTTLLASMQGYAPQIAIEFGRKVLYSTERPTFAELEGHVKKK